MMCAEAAGPQFTLQHGCRARPVLAGISRSKPGLQKLVESPRMPLADVAPRRVRQLPEGVCFVRADLSSLFGWFICTNKVWVIIPLCAWKDPA
jgi:hypothetical protein